MANADYYEIFTNDVKAIESYGTKIGNYPALFKLDEEWEEININCQGTTVNDVKRVDTIMITINKRTPYRMLGYIFVK